MFYGFIYHDVRNRRWVWRPSNAQVEPYLPSYFSLTSLHDLSTAPKRAKRQQKWVNEFLGRFSTILSLTFIGTFVPLWSTEVTKSAMCSHLQSLFSFPVCEFKHPERWCNLNLRCLQLGGWKKNWKTLFSFLSFPPFPLLRHMLHSHHRSASSSPYSIILHNNSTTRPITIMEKELYCVLCSTRKIYSFRYCWCTFLVNLIRCNGKSKGNFCDVFYDVDFKKEKRPSGWKLLTNPLEMCWCQREEINVDDHK